MNSRADGGAVAALWSVLPFLVVAGLAGPGDPDVVLEGQPLDIELNDGERARDIEVVLAREGVWTIYLTSTHGDAVFLVPDGQGGLAEFNQNAIPEWNEALVIQGGEGDSLRLAAGIKEGSGELTVELFAGELSETRQAELEAESWRGRGDVLAERGELYGACRALHKAGQAYFSLGEYLECQRCCRRAADIAEEIHDAFLRCLAYAYLGAVHEKFSEHSRARTLLHEALQFIRSGTIDTYKDRDVLDLFTATYLGEAELGLGDLEQGRAHLEEARGLARSLGDQAHASVLDARLSRLEFELGRPESAVQLADQAVSAARSHGDTRSLAAVLHERGRLHCDMFEYEQARRRLAEAEALAVRGSQRYAILGTRANLSLETGGSLDALAMYSDVLSYARAAGNRGLEIAALTSLSEACTRLGDYARANECLVEAREMLDVEGHSDDLGVVLHLIANVAILRGDLESPAGVLERALELARTEENPLLEARVLTSRAALHYYRGEYETGLDDAVAVRDIGIKNRLVEFEAAGTRAFAELQLRRGNLREAREASRHAIGLFRALGNRQLLQSALLTEVEIAYVEQDWARMESILDEAEGCLQSQASLDPERGAMLRARDDYAHWAHFAQDLVAAQIGVLSGAERQEALRTGFRRAGLWKARSLWQGIHEHRTGVTDQRRSHDDLLARRDAVWDELRAAMEAEEEARETKARADLATLQEAIEESARELRRRSPSEAQILDPQGASAGAIAKVLGTQRVLVEFVEGQRHLYAYVLRGSDLRFVSLGEREAVSDRVQAYRHGIEDTSRLLSSAELARHGGALYRELLAPLLTDAASEDLVIVPSEAVLGLPFEALVVDVDPSSEGGDGLVYVLDQRNVTYAASTPVLELLSTTGRPEPGPVLVLADAVFSTGSSGGRYRGWADLPGTREEALWLAAEVEAHGSDMEPEAIHDELLSLARESRSLSLSRDRFEMHLGATATAERLRDGLERYSVVHIASHAVADPQDWNKSGIVLSSSEAGDTFLTLTDVVNLRLNADLAVLSACQTGTGGVQASEGVRSLGRAFQHAGARTVVASLWPVDDAATQSVMRAFYAACLQEGSTISSALREARLALRRAGQETPGVRRGRRVQEASTRSTVGHPYYWASFVVSGLPDAALSLTAR